MQIAVASNLCCNLPALESLLWKIENLREEGRPVSKIYIIGILGLLPYAREIYEILSGLDNVVLVKGKFDKLISRADEKFEEKVPDFIKEPARWNWKSLGIEGRLWLKNIRERVVDEFNGVRYLFTYENPLNPLELVEACRERAYYEKIHEKLREYKVLVFAGKDEFYVRTSYGKVISPGSIGVKIRKKAKPSFIVIDTENVEVHSFEIDYDESEIKDRLKTVNFPKNIGKTIYKIYETGVILNLKV